MATYPPRLPAIAHPLTALNGSARHALKLLTLLILLAMGTYIVYATGGTGYAYPYVMLLPVMLGAAWYRIPGSLAMALIAGLLVGPFMPQDVQADVMQSTQNWLVRVGLYLLIGGYSGWLFHRMRYLARRDRKTQLPNSQALYEDLGQSLTQMQVYRHMNQDYEVLILNVRVIDLWEVIEVYGVEAADVIVQQLANEITKRLSFNDDFQLYRFSSSELILQVANKSKTSVKNLVQALEEAGEQVMNVKGVPVRVQLAVGSDYMTPDDKEVDLLLARVRSGLFSAIAAGEFHQHYRVTNDQIKHQRIRLISRVQEGLKRQEFELFYQPKICLKKGLVRGNEGLIRWRDGEGGYLSPAFFMPKVEATSLITPVTRFVITTAINFAKNHPDQTPASINFAANNLVDDSLLNFLFLEVERAGIPPNAIEIEITEGALIQEPAHARNNILQLRNQGFHVSIDDFGTGYSSFQYLKDLPITGLKLDQAFVKNIESDRHVREIMAGMIELSHRLHLVATVEGVETAEQADILADLGADLAQGYYFARPMPEQEYVDWAEHWSKTR